MKKNAKRIHANWLINFWCFNTTFNNISAILWRPVLVVEEAGVPGENHQPWASNWYSSVNGRFRVKTTEVRRVHVLSSLLVVTSNQNASNKKKSRLNLYPKPGMSHDIPCMIAE